MTDFLRLRHQLLPYLATMGLRAHTDGEPIVQPMYYDHPDDLAAYDVPNQFMFGSELLVAPITSPADPSTGLARVKAWLPEGTWTDVFTGLTYTGGRTVYLHRDLSSIPVLAKAWAIVPMVPVDALPDGTALPSVVEVHVYPGADGSFTLAEDADDDRWAFTRFSYDDATGMVAVHPVEGHAATLPGDRSYTIDVRTPRVPIVTTDDRVFAVLDRAQIGFELKAAAYDAVQSAPDAGAAVLALQGLDLSTPLLGALSEILLAR
jgi:alpha-glucosidase (family GH31 glycosyl hydrolase)